MTKPFTLSDFSIGKQKVFFSSSPFLSLFLSLSVTRKRTFSSHKSDWSLIYHHCSRSKNTLFCSTSNIESKNTQLLSHISYSKFDDNARTNRNSYSFGVNGQRNQLKWENCMHNCNLGKLVRNMRRNIGAEKFEWNRWNMTKWHFLNDFTLFLIFPGIQKTASDNFCDFFSWDFKTRRKSTANPEVMGDKIGNGKVSTRRMPRTNKIVYNKLINSFFKRWPRDTTNELNKTRQT